MNSIIHRIKAFFDKKGLTQNRSFIKYFSSNILSVPVSLITGFINFRNIDPIYMGMWATVTIFEVYANFLRLGIVNGMNRELPHAMGQGNMEKAKKYASTTYMFSLINILILLIITPFIVKGIKLDSSYYACLIVVLIKACLSFYTTYLQGTFRSDDQFSKLADITHIGLLAKLLLCPLVLLGFNGFLVYELILILLSAFLLHKFRPLKVKAKFYFPEMKSMFSIGFPLFLTSYFLGIIDTLPRLFIIKDGNQELLGIYAPVLMLLNTMMIFPGTITNFLYPKFSYKIGQKVLAMEIWKQYFKVIAFSFIGILVVVSIGYFFLDFFAVLFPKYALSVPYLKAALLICPFLVYKMGNTINGVLRKPQNMITFALFYGFFQVISYYVLLAFMNDVLLKVIYSQVITALATLIFSLVVNYLTVVNYDKQNEILTTN